MPSSLFWRRATKIRGATCGRPKVRTSCARSTPPDRRSPSFSPTATLFQRRHTRVSTTFAGIKRARRGPVDKKTALVLDRLRAAIQTIPETLPGRRDRALLLVGFSRGQMAQHADGIEF